MNKKQGHQLLHRKDKGELVLCEIDGDTNIVCKKCQAKWKFYAPILGLFGNAGVKIPKDFVRYKEPGKITKE